MANKDEYRFNVEFLKDAFLFLQTLESNAQEKVLENIRIARIKSDPRLLKKVNKEIWEFRTRYRSSQIRLLAFWDKRKKSLIVCTHGFVKKSQKINSKELNRAMKLRSKYLNDKT